MCRSLNFFILLQMAQRPRHGFSLCRFSRFPLSVLTHGAAHCPDCPETVLVLVSPSDHLFRPDLVFNFQVAELSWSFTQMFLIASCAMFGSAWGLVAHRPPSPVSPGVCGVWCVSSGPWAQVSL